MVFVPSASRIITLVDAARKESSSPLTITVSPRTFKSGFKCRMVKV